MNVKYKAPPGSKPDSARFLAVLLYWWDWEIELSFSIQILPVHGII
ncbi:MAG: hypothetical protein H7Y18_17180 [Clostridiaceae bacterium]|nr:hypothetical protein [Clostridiaceae bacterium]